MSDTATQARAFLAGEALTFAVANELWRRLQREDELSLARLVLVRLRKERVLLDTLPADRRTKEELCRQEALLTSKDPELNAADRHDLALAVLAEHFDIDDARLDGDGETLGIAAGIYKRRWNDLGQLQDLILAQNLYERGASGPLGEDAYPHINAAFLDDVLAEAGQEPPVRRERAERIRQRIVAELPAGPSWWNAATRAEALFGLRRYTEATSALADAKKRDAPWTLETTARQLGTLAHLQEKRPLDVPAIREFFAALLPGAPDAAHSAIIGKVGLALSGGGFRASFYHLGVLARLAELDVLRHVDVLSCVSGGSIVGTCYWLALRRRLLAPRPLGRGEYIDIVAEVIEHFSDAVATNLRGGVQPSRVGVVWQTLKGGKGALDPEKVAAELEAHFYRPLWPGSGSLHMHDLPFQPTDHDLQLAGSPEFHPGKHNWLRTHKVPVLVLNATCVNTGHAWQFTPTWMGESPWSIHQAADSVPRLQWSWYEPEAGWKMTVGRAVAASACVHSSSSRS